MTLMTPDDPYCPGELDDGLPHGYGALTSASADVHAGTWVHGALHGKGQLRRSNGESYLGDFADGTPAGTGTYIFASQQARQRIAEHPFILIQRVVLRTLGPRPDRFRRPKFGRKHPHHRQRASQPPAALPSSAPQARQRSAFHRVGCWQVSSGDTRGVSGEGGQR